MLVIRQKKDQPEKLSNNKPLQKGTQLKSYNRILWKTLTSLRLGLMSGRFWPFIL